MRASLIMSLFIAAVACGRVQVGGLATDAILNPNFDQGLTGWETTGMVSVVDIQGVAGVTKAALLTYDGNTATSLAQTVTLSKATYLGVTAQAALSPNGVLVGPTASGSIQVGNDPTFRLVGGTWQASAGPSRIVWSVGTDPNLLGASPPGTRIWITGMHLQVDAPEPPRER